MTELAFAWSLDQPLLKEAAVRHANSRVQANPKLSAQCGSRYDRYSGGGWHQTNQQYWWLEREHEGHLLFTWPSPLFALFIITSTCVGRNLEPFQDIMRLEYFSHNTTRIRVQRTVVQILKRYHSLHESYLHVGWNNCNFHASGREENILLEKYGTTNSLCVSLWV